MMKKILFILLLVLSEDLYSQSIRPDFASVGFIVIGDNNYSGTGFVLNSKRQVLTCAHVIDTNYVIYYSSAKLIAAPMKKYKLTLVKVLPEFDLAVLTSEVDLCERPFTAEPAFEFTPYQHLFYFGYSVQSSNDTIKYIQVNNAYVTSKGVTFINKSIINFIEFTGVGLPGYSGGPVVDDNGKVVGIMREAWLKQGIKGGPVALINRAFSITPILE